VSESKGSLNILRIILAVRETSAPYNQFSLAWADKHNITLCTYFASDIMPPKSIPLFEGDGSLKGFFQALKNALKLKKYDVIHIHSPHLGFLFLLATLFSNRKLLRSTVITAHDSYQNYKFRNRLMFIPVFASFRRIVCCGQASYDSFPSLFKLLAGRRLCVVPNSLDIARVDRIAASIGQRPRTSGDFAVVAVSRLVDIKNPFAVLMSFQQGTNQTGRLIYMGDGPLRQSLIRKSQEAAHPERIEFTGLVPREKVFENLLNADVFISTSRGEGLPVSVLEAMACRCPVLLSDIPPHREIAEGLDFIPLVHPDDTAGFAREIKKFSEMSVSERQALGEICRKVIEDRFSLPAMHAGYEEVYSQIMDNRVSPLLKTNVLSGNKPKA
jgi:glycosyltransferase involved in cell wall biosynthesis